MPATDVAAGKKLRRILIFDDHPDSLRLALGQSTKSPVHRPAPQTARWWDPVLGWMLIIGAVLVMFSPLFLKFTS